MNNPLFSIGITTYNRQDLLSEILVSLINQQFWNFEILIGNDYVTRPLTKEILKINDDRVVIFNHERNIGELENMNFLLKEAKGDYFSWLYDDDLCAPDLLDEINNAIQKYNYPDCVFSSFFYSYGDSVAEKITKRKANPAIKYSGREFLRLYLSGAIRVLGTGGFYKTEFLRKTGGAFRLSFSGMAIYSEYLLIFNAALLEHVIYIDSGLLGFRVHEASWSCTSSDVEFHKQAGLKLVGESIRIFSARDLIDDYEKNLNSLLKSVISVVITKVRLSERKFSRKEISKYISEIEEEFNVFTDAELTEKSLRCLSNTRKYIPLFRIKAVFRRIVPVRHLKYFHSFIHLVSGYTNKSF